MTEQTGDASKFARDGSASGSAVPIATAEWNAGDLACGDLVLALRQKLAQLAPGDVLKVISLDAAAPIDMPAWCRVTGNPLVAMAHPEYYIRRKEP